MPLALFSCISLLLLLLPSATSASTLLQATDTPAPTSTPEPTATWEPLYKTPTPAPTKDTACCEGTPIGWGSCTPAAEWLVNCNQCAPVPTSEYFGEYTPWPTLTPYPTMTPYASSTPGGPTLTPGPTAEPDYFVGAVQMPSATCVKGGEWSARCYFLVEHESYAGSEIVGAVFDMCKESSGCGEINAWGPGQALPDFWNDGVWDHSYQHQCPSVGTRCTGNADACEQLYPGEPYTPDMPIGGTDPGDDMLIGWLASSNACSYFDVYDVRLIYYGAPGPTSTPAPTGVPTPLPTGTPTVTSTPVSGTYCCSLVCDSGEDPSAGILPIIRVGVGTCATFDPVDLSVIGLGTLPGFELCLTPIRFGSVGILGVSISLDFLSIVLAGLLALRLLWRS